MDYAYAPPFWLAPAGAWDYGHPGWEEYAQDWGGWPYPYVGLDYPGKEWAEKLGEKLGQLGTAASNTWKNISQGVPEFHPLGDAPQKAAAAADATTLAAEEARRSIAALSQKADRTLAQVDRTAREHEETVRIAKYVMVGVAVLGGAALLYAVAK